MYGQNGASAADALASFDRMSFELLGQLHSKVWHAIILDLPWSLSSPVRPILDDSW
jgi:hypothetical protein